MAILQSLEDGLFIERFSVYFWKDYQFQDSAEYKDKFVITMNCVVSEFPLTIILPTSKINGAFYSKPDNLVDCVIIDVGESKFFTYRDVKTVIDLKNIVEEDKEFIEAAYSEGEFQFLGILEVELQKRIIKAIEDSITLEEYLVNKYLCK